MRLAVIGLGHLGAVTAGCFAKLGHHIVGVDRDGSRVAAVNRGSAPIGEKNLAQLFRAAHKRAAISAIDRITPAVFDCDLIFVCVDTPPTAKGPLNTARVLQVCERLRELSLKSKRAPIVAVRSTLSPGTFERTLAKFQSSPGRLRLFYNPDFTREGQAVADFLSPQRIVIGVGDRRDAHKLLELYQGFNAPTFVTAWNNAEVLKCTDNAFHALKVTFANEIGGLCSAFGANGEEVMRLVCTDARLNISSAYLRPGLPFGGPCLSKDVGALVGSARLCALRTPLLESIQKSNDRHFERIIAAIKRKGYSVGFLGLSFKSGVTDSRGSQLLTLANRLREEGVTVRVFDPQSEDPVKSTPRRRNQPAFIRSGSRAEVLANSDVVFSPDKVQSLVDLTA